GAAGALSVGFCLGFCPAGAVARLTRRTPGPLRASCFSFPPATLPEVAAIPPAAVAADAPDPRHWVVSCAGSTVAAATTPPRQRPPSGTATGATTSDSQTALAWSARSAGASRPGTLPSPGVTSGRGSRLPGGSGHKTTP